ncbi:hypothetical protein GGS24DRAFT_77735 [Hypoxylon argillaceum]|nr:hypothetical protein GGS24DRAFT_77735 [Hypoxylon argillaceum]
MYRNSAGGTRLDIRQRYITSKKGLIDANGSTITSSRGSRTSGMETSPGTSQRLAEDIMQTTRQNPQHKPPKFRDTSLPQPKVEGHKQAPPATQVCKRQMDSEDDDDHGHEHELKRVRLTRKNLARLNKMAKKKGASQGSAPTSTALDSTADSSSTEAISTTSPGFASRALGNGILDPLDSKPPTNLENIQEQHARSRATASPTESMFKSYSRAVLSAGNEATVVHVVNRHMLKEYNDDGYQKVFNRAFTAFPKNVGFNNSLSAPQPDFTEGLVIRKYKPFPVDEHVSGAVLYNDNPYSITLPHLAGEWKGPDGNMEEAELQSRYDGAALVYSRNQALSLMGKSDPPGHAEVRTFTTDGTLINFYAHYATLSEDTNMLEYHQYQYAVAPVKGTYQGHKDGYRGIRNEQDHAKGQAYALKDQLNKHWKQRRSGLQPITEGSPLPDLDEFPGASSPAQKRNASPNDWGKIRELHPPANFTRYRRTKRGALLPCGIDDESSYGIIDKPSYAPTTLRSSEERRRSARLSKRRQRSSEDITKMVSK